MKKIRMTIEGILGCILLMISGVIFTFERFISVFLWIGQAAPVKINGSGSYPGQPIMPGIFDNIFVPIFFVMGLILIFINLKIEKGDSI